MVIGVTNAGAFVYADFFRIGIVIDNYGQYRLFIAAIKADKFVESGDKCISMYSGCG